MSNTSRVDKELFREAHYLGKPADDTDLIVRRRIELLYQFPGFFHKELNCLEIGCGTGATINRVAAAFNSVLGIDIVDYSAAFREQQEKLNVTNSSFQVVNLEKDHWTGQFQRIISFEVIEHFQDENTVARFFELLAPGGLAAITVPNKWWVFETHGAKLPLLAWNRVPFFSWLPRPIHERWANARIYTRGRITRLLRKHGFQIERSQYVTAPMDVLKESRLKRWLLRNVFRNSSTAIPFLATAVFVIARKPGNQVNG